uniref:Uncharacterized protein n=1 Tax=Anguilla anguilla TaxID=7936 RepID=A0A0E9W592_ANGAN
MAKWLSLFLPSLLPSFIPLFSCGDLSQLGIHGRVRLALRTKVIRLVSFVILFFPQPGLDLKEDQYVVFLSVLLT